MVVREHTVLSGCPVCKEVIEDGELEDGPDAEADISLTRKSFGVVRGGQQPIRTLSHAKL